MWDEGVNARPSKYRKVNKEIAKLKGDLSLRDAQIWLYKFFRANIAFAADTLLDVKLFPHQVLMIKSVLEGDYTLGVISRGGSKTFCVAISAFLYALFNPGVKIGIFGPTFRQSRGCFTKIEDILNKPGAALGAACVTGTSKQADQWVMRVGQSEIYALPMGSGGEKLRGFRFQLMIIDEFLLMDEAIYNEVLLPFLAVVTNPHERAEMRALEDKLIAEGKMTEEERYVWQNNKMVAISSASYRFDYLYKLYKKFDQLILEGRELDEETGKMKSADNAQRIIIHMAYDAIPSELYDENLLNQSRSTMSQAQFDREFNSVFLDDSGGFFKVSKMRDCTISEGMGQTIELTGFPGDKYIVAVDPSWSEGESSDDFAIQVLKLGTNGRAILVHSFALSGHNLNTYMRYFLYIMQAFKPVLVVCDYMGGVVFINACNESAMFKDAKINIKELDVSFDDHTEYEKDLAKFKREHNVREGRICIFRKPTSKWIRDANELLQSNFDHKKILFASNPVGDEYQLLQRSDIPIDTLTYRRMNAADKGLSGKAKLIDFIDHIPEMIQLTKDECALITISTSSLGTQSFDLPSNLKRQSGPDKARKDSYSALVLGSWGAKIWFDVHSDRVKPNQTFMPFFIQK